MTESNLISTYQFVTHADRGNLLIELQSMTLPSGGTVHYEVDARGNQTHVRDDDGDVIFERTFNPDGTSATFTDRFGTVSSEYDAPQGLPTRVTEPGGAVTELDYDNNGNVIELRRDGVTERFIRDAAGRPCASTTATARTTLGESYEPPVGLF